MADQIQVLPDDVERDAHTGKHSDYRYRRFHIRSIDTWGVAKYSRVLEFAGRDAQIWIAQHSPIHVPLSKENESGIPFR